MSRSFALAGIALFAAAIPLVAAGLVGAGVDVSRALALAYAAAMRSRRRWSSPLASRSCRGHVPGDGW
jgi:hypothetical protein